MSVRGTGTGFSSGAYSAHSITRCTALTMYIRYYSTGTTTVATTAGDGTHQATRNRAPESHKPTKSNGSTCMIVKPTVRSAYMIALRSSMNFEAASYRTRAGYPGAGPAAVLNAERPLH
jgi:hypothetical protein